MKHTVFHKNLSDLILGTPSLDVEIVRSIIELIDPVRTGRKHLSDLEKTEKTYIGTKVENILRYHLKLNRDEKLDCVVGKTEFDVKCTVGNNWMIPEEAINHFCLLVKIDWESMEISLGTFHATLENLTVGKNKDKKSSVSSKGKNTILWIYDSKTFVMPDEIPHVTWKKP